MILSDAFDLIVIGCGPAGEKGAAQAAYFGKRVAIVERAEHMGGSCINTGTVPSKTLRESALYFSARSTFPASSSAAFTGSIIRSRKISPSTISCTMSVRSSIWSASAF